MPKGNRFRSLGLTERHTVRFAPEEDDALRREAETLGISPSDLIRHRARRHHCRDCDPALVKLRRACAGCGAPVESHEEDRRCRAHKRGKEKP